jgi:hypothetical protein
VFHTGWPGLGGPAGLLMVRTDEKASGKSGAGFEKVVTVIAPGQLNWTFEKVETGASRTPATGSRPGSDPVAASEEEHPLHADHCIKSAPTAKTPACATLGR